MRAIIEALDDASAGDVPEDPRIEYAAELVDFALNYLRKRYLRREAGA